MAFFCCGFSHYTTRVLLSFLSHEKKKTENSFAAFAHAKLLPKNALPLPVKVQKSVQPFVTMKTHIVSVISPS